MASGFLNNLIHCQVVSLSMAVNSNKRMLTGLVMLLLLACTLSTATAANNSTTRKLASVPSGFVTRSGTGFAINGQKWVPVGFNAYWMAFKSGLGYPTHAQIDEMFYVAQQMKATVIRCFSLGWSSNYAQSLINSDLTINTAAWPAIDYILYKANQAGIKLIATMTQEYEYDPGDVTAFTNHFGKSAPQFWTDRTCINAFKLYLSTWLNHVNSLTGIQIKNDPALCMIETGNEIGNIRSDINANTIPPQSWISEIAAYIKSIDRNHLVLDGSDECLGSSTSNDFGISSIDVYSAHFYGEDYARLNAGAQNAANVGKPYIIGEYNSHFDSSWFSAVEANPNVKGTLFWSMFPHTQGTAGGPQLLAGTTDEYTLWYDSTFQSDLLRLTNHMRRMQGLVQVASPPGLLKGPGNLAADWAFCSGSGECADGCCSKQYSNDGKYKCTPGGSPNQCLGNLGDWQFCVGSSQCNNGCCSKQFSNDGKYKCTPGGTGSQCLGGLGDWQFCVGSSQCTDRCCSKQFSNDGRYKCTPGGSQCLGA